MILKNVKKKTIAAKWGISPPYVSVLDPKYLDFLDLSAAFVVVSDEGSKCSK